MKEKVLFLGDKSSGEGVNNSNEQGRWSNAF